MSILLERLSGLVDDNFRRRELHDTMQVQVYMYLPLATRARCISPGLHTFDALYSISCIVEVPFTSFPATVQHYVSNCWLPLVSFPNQATLLVG